MNDLWVKWSSSGNLSLPFTHISYIYNHNEAVPESVLDVISYRSELLFSVSRIQCWPMFHPKRARTTESASTLWCRYVVPVPTNVIWTCRWYAYVWNPLTPVDTGCRSVWQIVWIKMRWLNSWDVHWELHFTYWGRLKVAAVLHTTFSNWFSYCTWILSLKSVRMRGSWQ